MPASGTDSDAEDQPQQAGEKAGGTDDDNFHDNASFMGPDGWEAALSA